MATNQFNLKLIVLNGISAALTGVIMYLLTASENTNWTLVAGGFVGFSALLFAIGYFLNQRPFSLTGGWLGSAMGAGYVVLFQPIHSGDATTFISAAVGMIVLAPFYQRVFEAGERMPRDN
ncbi:hypothetical protein [Haloterrigena salifodinae]|uniref:hypothetical protein n=1 Tax=Haloterrigena salifodinae TaxID=2675099 RepID=UPI000F870632|nr:hypothetical protein [Haloterrigena salifodinae]